MVVTQQEIEVFRAVLANRSEYQEAQKALSQKMIEIWRKPIPF